MEFPKQLQKNPPLKLGCWHAAPCSQIHALQNPLLNQINTNASDNDEMRTEKIKLVQQSKKLQVYPH